MVTEKEQKTLTPNPKSKTQVPGEAGNPVATEHVQHMETREQHDSHGDVGTESSSRPGREEMQVSP